jgi:Zn/Cd-binding protein ZinT
MTKNDAYVYYGANYENDVSSIVIQNDDLAIHRGTANAYPFRGYLTPRYFNGALIYRRKY